MAAVRRSRSTLIVLMLVATLAMAAILAYEAHQAARSHRATAENVLRDYSKFATWELTRLGRQQLLNEVNKALSDLQNAARRDRLHGLLGPGNSCPSGCGSAHRFLTTFSAPLPDAQFTFVGGSVNDAVRATLAEAVAAGMRKPQDFTCPALRVVNVNGAPAVVVWRPTHDGFDKPNGVVGFVADVPFVSHIFEGLLRHTPLLPPTLVQAGANANSALAVRIETPEGQPLFASSREWSPYEASEQLTRDLGMLKLSVALKPEAAEKLVIGGLPRERLRLVVGLLALTAGLVVVALVQLRREAELSRMRADFVSGVSHELRTPLAQIRMFTETLLLGRVRSPGEGRRSLEIVARETQRLIELVENVLVFSRGERRRPQITRESTRLAPLIADVVESFIPLAAARDARLTTTLDETVSANVDGGAVRRILLNLLDNAVKYGPAGQVVNVTLCFDAGRARLIVDDQGPGVDAADAERVWQPFYRLPRSADATGGSGIGLTIVRQLTELHGGRAWVERAPAGGARFVVELPDACATVGAEIAVA